MKKQFLYALVLAFYFNSNAQVTQLNESFTAPFSAASSGWFIQNNSNPLGTTTWAQGAGTVFTAYSGSSNDYLCANYNSQGTSAGDISNFLVTPTVSLMNGGVLKFYTRTQANPATYPDRLQVRMSIGTGTGNIANSVTAVGTFTALLTTINPNLTGSGYPGVWTAYTMTISGISGTVTGRFAFRYDVTDGGLNGTNSNFIGIDDVEYTTSSGPCPQAPVIISPSSATICQGMGPVNLVGSGASTYTWSHNGSHNASSSVNPVSTTVYTLSGSGAGYCPGAATATVYIVQPPTNLSAPNVTACPGGTVMLTATGANSYTWTNGPSGSPAGTGSSVVVYVTGSTYYMLTGATAPGCEDYTTVQVTVNNFLNTTNPSPVACPNQTLIIGVSGAVSYTWNTGASSPSIVITPTANVTYTVTGFDGNCTESMYFNVSIDPNLFAPSFTTCAGTSATLFASGANSYSWSTGSSSTSIIVSPSVTTVYTLTGTSGACSVTKNVTVTIGNSLSVNCSQVCLGSSLLLSAYGASSYTWLPINDFNASVIVTPTAATVYTLIGTSGTCKGTRTIQVTYCAGVEDEQLSINENVLAYPNPFTDELNISGAEGHLRITNLFGQILHEETIDGNSKINVSEYSAGIYFVIVTHEGKMQRRVIRVVKN